MAHHFVETVSLPFIVIARLSISINLAQPDVINLNIRTCSLAFKS